MRLPIAIVCAVLLGMPLTAAALGFQDVTIERSRNAGSDLFVIDSDATVLHLWQTDQGGKWSRLESLGGTAKDLAVATLTDGRFEVFVVGSDDAVWRNTQQPSKRGWTGWRTLGGQVERVAIEKTKSGRYELLLRGKGDNQVWHRAREPGSDEWGEWERLGGTAKELAAAASGADGMEIFVIGSDSAIWHSANGIDWESLGGEAKDVSVGRLPNGGIQVFVIGRDNAIWRIGQSKAGASWGEWESLGGEATHIGVAESKQTGLELIALTANGGLSRRAQTRPGGVWGEWRTLGEVSPFDTTFAGEATVTIPELNVSEQKTIALGIRFSFDRRIVQITSFPPIETKRFDTPIGSNKTTVTMTGDGIGTFEAASGRFAIPVALKFDQSVNVAMVQEDAAVKLELSTEAEGGSVLDRATAHVALGASGKFTGSGSINPLRNKAVTMLISGKLDPLPVKRVATKK